MKNGDQRSNLTVQFTVLCSLFVVVRFVFVLLVFRFLGQISPLPGIDISSSLRRYLCDALGRRGRKSFSRNFGAFRTPCAFDDTRVTHISWRGLYDTDALLPSSINNNKNNNKPLTSSRLAFELSRTVYPVIKSEYFIVSNTLYIYIYLNECLLEIILSQK